MSVCFERASNGTFERASNGLRTRIRTGFERVCSHTPLTPHAFEARIWHAGRTGSGTGTGEGVSCAAPPPGRFNLAAAPIGRPANFEPLADAERNARDRRFGQGAHRASEELARGRRTARASGWRGRQQEPRPACAAAGWGQCAPIPSDEKGTLRRVPLGHAGPNRLARAFLEFENSRFGLENFRAAAGRRRSQAFVPIGDIGASRELSPAERADATARRKEIYKVLHPEAAHGGDRRGPSRQVGDLKASAFTKATILATGQSERVVQRDARRGRLLAYDAAKRAARLARGKDAHDSVVAAAHRAQADALEIEIAAKRRLADEYDAAQRRGEVATARDGNAGRSTWERPATAADLGLSRKQVHESRALRDAEAAAPGATRAALDNLVAAGEELTRGEVARPAEDVAR